jgi:hypothetical protein
MPRLLRLPPFNDLVTAPLLLLPPFNDDLATAPLLLRADPHTCRGADAACALLAAQSARARFSVAAQSLELSEYCDRTTLIEGTY